MPHDQLLVIILLIGGICLFLLIVVFASYFKQRGHASRAKKLARDLNLKYHGMDGDFLNSLDPQMSFFGPCDRLDVRYVVHGAGDYGELWIFQIRRITFPPGMKIKQAYGQNSPPLFSFGGSRFTWTEPETVVLLRSPKFTLPRFELHHDEYSQESLERLGLHEIDLEARPDHDPQYRVFGPHEAPVVRFFRPTLADWFAERPGVSASANENELAICYPGVILDNEQLRLLIADLERFVLLLVASAEESAPPRPAPVTAIDVDLDLENQP